MVLTDTSAFAVATLTCWWDTIGRTRYPGADQLLICADSGGSNGSRVRAWKIELAVFAAATGSPSPSCTCRSARASGTKSALPA